MGDSCCSSDCSSNTPLIDKTYRRILWIALAINAGMFLAEIIAGLTAGSAALTADAMDFLSDAGNYAVSLMVLGMASRIRSKAALAKGLSLGVIGLFVAGNTLYSVLVLKVPSAEVMGIVGSIALLANGSVAVLLYAFRRGDANMRSVWICARNDAIGNVAVILAAIGVFGTGTGWPDVIVAAIMASLSLCGALQIVRHAVRELRRAPALISAE